MREHELYCTIQWTDTKKFEIVLQKNIRLPPSQRPELNVTYTIFIDGVRRHGTVFATGKMNNVLFTFR
jgi:hypothetical protein